MGQTCLWGRVAKIRKKMRKCLRRFIDLTILIGKGAYLAFSTTFLYLKFRFLKWRRGKAFRKTLEDQGMDERLVEELSQDLNELDLKDLLQNIG